jgi:hypothetical protein
MANQGNQGGKSNRGLASADKETRERVAREGGKARGDNSSSGGNSNRGSGSSDNDSRERTSREGGKSSGGGR